MDPVTIDPAEPESFEELRSVYDAAVTSAAVLRSAMIEARAPYDEQIARIEARWALENAELIKEEQEQSNLAELAEQELRAAILAAYKLDPSNKQVAPHLNLSVQARKEVLITDEKVMAEWLKSNTGFMTPDLTAIKKAAKDPKLRDALKMEDFTEIKEKPVAVIGKLEPDEE